MDESNDEKIVFYTGADLSKVIKKIQKELDIDDPAEVLALGVSLLEVSIGRNVVLEDLRNKKKYRISRFSGHRQTVMLNGEDEQE